MVVTRATALSGAFGRTVFRRSGAAIRARTSRQLGRRTYASGHGEQKSSEIPWIIGSVAFTVPAATWLIGQGPKKGEHGHGGHDHKAEMDEASKEEAGEGESNEDQPPQEDSADQPEEKKDDGEDSDAKDESSDDTSQSGEGDSSDKEGKSDDSKSGDSGNSGRALSEDGYELPGPNAPGQINWNSGMNKGPGEGQKGERKPTEKKAEKDSASDKSGAKHPYIDHPEKSKKGVGVTETAKIHGTVDPSAPARGPKGSGSSASSSSAGTENTQRPSDDEE